MADQNAEYPTIIGADAVFKGELQFEKGVRLLGKFEGEVSSGGQLDVAKGAILQGNVTAATISIEGQVKGNLSASSKVALAASAKLEGDVQAQRLEVAEGAVLIGRCVIGVNGQGGGTTTRSASAPVSMVDPTKSKPPQPVPAPTAKR
jgi:cytoskeletal protein CcmA (bactofilin family)